MIHFYGSPMSSSSRTHWMLEETGVPYEYHVVHLREPQSRAAYLEVNPGGKVPYLVDGDLRLAESVAINFYLAERYQPAMMPTDLAERAQVYQWSLWAITNLQPETLKIIAYSALQGDAARIPDQLASSREQCKRYLDVLEQALVGDYLLGDRFTVADVNTGSIVNLALMTRAAVPGPRVGAWSERLRSRPAHGRAAAQVTSTTTPTPPPR
jgi:glutathione S-transferase